MLFPLTTFAISFTLTRDILIQEFKKRPKAELKLILKMEEEIPSTEGESYSDLFEAWVDLQEYIRENFLPWLDTPDSSLNFLRLCGYQEEAFPS